MTGSGEGAATAPPRFSTYEISLLLFIFSFFFPLFLISVFISGVDYIRGEGSNYPRKFDTAPGTRNPGAPTAPGSLFFCFVFVLCVPFLNLIFL